MPVQARARSAPLARARACRLRSKAKGEGRLSGTSSSACSRTNRGPERDYTVQVQGDAVVLASIRPWPDKESALSAKECMAQGERTVGERMHGGEYGAVAGAAAVVASAGTS